jgi:hypothetical protein
MSLKLQILFTELTEALEISVDSRTPKQNALISSARNAPSYVKLFGNPIQVEAIAPRSSKPSGTRKQRRP